MAKNTGIGYEKLIQQIFDAIINEKSVETVDVQHDVIVKGKSTDHQIDVYWQFKVGDIDYTTIVQAKDWDSTVNQGELLKFAEILKDIPGQPRGIFITKTGYQKGAFDVAKANGILLYELRKPNEKDWDGKIKDIIIQMQLCMPSISNVHLIIDTDWFDNKCEQENILLNQCPVHFGGRPAEIFLYNASGEKLKCLQDVFNEYISSDYPDTEIISIKHSFSDDVFMDTNSPEFPIVKVREISFDLEILYANETIQILGDNVVQFILKNVIDDEYKRIGPNLRPY